MTVPRDTSPAPAGTSARTNRRSLIAIALPAAVAVAVLLPLQASALWSVEATPATVDSTPFGVAVVGSTPWFTEQDKNNIASVNPATGAVTEVPVSSGHPNAKPQALVYEPASAGVAGNSLWFPERNPVANVIVRYGLAGGALTEFPIPTAGAGAVGITIDGTGNIWFTETVVGKIGKVACSAATTCTVTEYSANITSAAAPLFITYRASDNSLWWTDRDSSAIGSATLTAGVPAIHPAIPVAANSQPYGITVGPDNNIWYTQHLGNAVAKIDAACATGGACPAPYVVATSASAPAGIVTGPDGNLWFTEQRGNKIAKMHVSGALAGEFLVSRVNAGPNLIAAAPDRLWFAESGLCIGTGCPSAGTNIPGERLASASIGMSGYYNDGYGGLHPWWTANSPMPPQMTYAPGDGVYSTQIIKTLAMRQDGVSGYTMDTYGGLHGFGSSTSALPPYMHASWSGFPTAPLGRGAALCPDQSGGEVVDAYGGVHPFTAPGAMLPGTSLSDLSSYWPGRDYARGIVLTSCSTTSVKGYVLDLFGGISPFATGGAANFPPRFVNIGTAFNNYWPGRDLARAVVLRPYAPTASPANPNGNGVSGYTLDAWGGNHPIGSTDANIPPTLASNGAAYSSDLIAGLALGADGSNAWSVDVYGGVHVLGLVNGLNNPRIRDYYPGNRIITNIGGVG